jgi:RNase H-fold protein (predicted Holliday junction resolvase)
MENLKFVIAVNFPWISQPLLPHGEKKLFYYDKYPKVYDMSQPPCGLTSAFLGFDPGRQKCGLAILGEQGNILYHQVIPAEQVIANIQSLCDTYPIQTLVIGDQTSSKDWQKRLRTTLPDSLTIVPIDERYSSQHARDRYWQMYPPKGLCRLIPLGMRVPPRPVDDIVAIILVERYLQELRADQ